MGRAPCCDKANVKKGPWSPEEDSKLKAYIEKNGTGGNWIALPQKAGLKRCGKSCRLRWLNYLRPNIKHGEFSDEEDRIICNLYASIGSRWSIIAARLPGRTDNDIKNYWNTKLKKKLMAMAPQSQRKLQPSPFIPTSHYQFPSHSIFSLYKDSTSAVSFSCYPAEAKSFPGFDHPISPMLSSNLFGSNSSSNLASLFQTQESSSLLATTGPMQHYQPVIKDNMLVFGSDQASCSSNNSDGSCSQISYGGRDIKQEADMGFQSFISNGYEENQKFMLSNYGSNNSNGGENQNLINQWTDRANGYLGETSSLQDYETDHLLAQDVKQLIISSNVNNNFVIDENKTQLEKMMMYYN